MQQALKRVYDDDTDATAVCELLVDVDEGMQEWRYHHVKMVERTIGGRRGTGGSAGATYLRHARPAHLPRPVGGQDHGLGPPPVGQHAMKPRIQGVPTHWIPGSMASGTKVRPVPHLIPTRWWPAACW